MNRATLIPDEHSRSELNLLFTKILHDVAPGEVPKLANVAARSDSIRIRKRGLPGVLEAGVAVHLVAGTMALIDIYMRKKERKEQRDFETSIQQEWQKALIQAGMSAELARQIPVKYSADVIRFITTQRVPEQPRDEKT